MLKYSYHKGECEMDKKYLKKFISYCKLFFETIFLEGQLEKTYKSNNFCVSSQMLELSSKISQNTIKLNKYKKALA